MTNPGGSDEWWKLYGGAGVSPESGAQPPAAGAYEYPSLPPTPDPVTEYPSQPAPQPPQPQYPNYQQPYPQGGYYGYQSPAGYQSYGYPPYQQGTNGLAIASLCCSLASIATCGVTAIVGIVLGIAALSQINKTGQSGRGMALGGIWVGVGLVVLFVAYIVLVVVISAAAG